MATQKMPIVLIEPHAGDIGGHWTASLTALARAAIEAGHLTQVVVLGGCSPETRTVLLDLHVQVIERPVGLACRALYRAGWACHRLSAAARRLVRHRRFPHQLTLLGRCLIEAASLRSGRPGAVAVILTASEALHGMTATLANRAHLRWIHDVYTTEDWPLRLLGRQFRIGLGRTLAVCTTGTVEASLQRQFPGLATVVRTFALADSGDAVSAAERADARRHFGLTSRDTAVVLVGGWWPHKDIDTVRWAMERLSWTLHLIVAGQPVDQQLLERLGAAPAVRLHTLIYPLQAAEMRMVYAAADATLVSRHPGTTRESGLVADAIRYAIPLICSDHDPELTRQLTDEPWARTFHAGDADDLARILETVVKQHLPRPAAADARKLGLASPADTISALIGFRTTTIEGVRR